MYTLFAYIHISSFLHDFIREHKSSYRFKHPFKRRVATGQSEMRRDSTGRRCTEVLGEE
jgi:hypothetical protein